MSPKMWSGWKWEISIVPIFAGSMPAAFIFAGILPAVGFHWPPEPESTITYLPPMLRTTTVSGMETNSGVRAALTSASFVSSTDAFLMKAGSCGFSHMPS